MYITFVHIFFKNNLFSARKGKLHIEFHIKHKSLNSTTRFLLDPFYFFLNSLFPTDNQIGRVSGLLLFQMDHFCPPVRKFHLSHYLQCVCV